MKRLLPVVTFGALALLGTSAWANTSEFIVSGEGEAVITTGAGTVTITLTDLYVNPGSVADSMSAFIFSLSGTAPTIASVASSSATAITVNGSGTSGYSVGSTVTPGWAISLSGAATSLDDLVGPGHAGPAHTIIGAPGAGSLGYSNADGSIAGNGPHNPFLDQSATFVLDENNVTASTNVTSTTFQFGTTDGTGQVNGTLVPTPEPSTQAMLGGGALLMAFVMMRRRAAAAGRIAN